MGKSRKFIVRLFKWTAILIAVYFFGTTLYFGHVDVDERKGMYNFYWSGLNGLWIQDKAFGFSRNQPVVTKLDGFDGPYIFDGRVYSVNEKNQLSKHAVDTSQSLEVKVFNDDQDAFAVDLRNAHQQEPDNFSMPARLIAISDIESNFNAFYSFLVNNEVIDKQYNWTFGKGHLVLNGDFIDRGKNATQVLWLIYSLEKKAALAGGKVHYILGNHEIMNMYGDASYADYKYREVAKNISGEERWDRATSKLYSADSEIGKWLRTKNIVLKIGDYLFVHAGLNSQHVVKNLTINELNSIAKKYYGVDPQTSSFTEKEALVLKAYSPYWDRSLAMNMMYRVVFLANDPFNAPTHKATQTEVESILEYYNGDKMVIGHSVVDDITNDYEGKVIKIDVKHGLDKDSGLTKGLLIENGSEYKIDDLGKKQRL